VDESRTVGESKGMNMGGRPYLSENMELKAK
jgi:hypothetical protein